MSPLSTVSEDLLHEIAQAIRYDIARREISDDFYFTSGRYYQDKERLAAIETELKSRKA